MKKFKYLKISNTKKLRFIDNYYKNKLYIVFLPGFMSDIDGKKPQAFKKYAVENKLGFSLRILINILVKVYKRNTVAGTPNIVAKLT